MSRPAGPIRATSPTWWVGVVGLVLATLFAVRVLASADWDPTIFVAFGEEAEPTRVYAEERLGDVFLRPAQGHDGKFFFVQANDPWVLDPDSNASVLDRPLYRSQRMLYPVLAGGLGLLGPGQVVWGMLVVNLLAMGLGSWAVAHVARAMGGSKWWGLAFGLNLGFVSEVNISGAGVVAGAAAFGAVALLLRERIPPAVLLLSLAALSREAMLIAAAGSAWWLWRRRERRAAALAALVPAAPAAVWAAYLRLRITFDTGLSEVQELGPPFGGFIDAFPAWLDDPVDLAVGVAMMVLFLAYTRRVLISNRLVGWTFLGFVPLALLFTRQVWLNYFDITRAVAPLITSFVLLVFLSASRGSPEAGGLGA